MRRSRALENDRTCVEWLAWAAAARAAKQRVAAKYVTEPDAPWRG